MSVALATGAVLIGLFVYLTRGLAAEREQLYELLTLQAEQFGAERAGLLDRIQAPEAAVATSLTDVEPRRMYRTEDDEVKEQRAGAAALIEAELRARGA